MRIPMGEDAYVGLQCAAGTVVDPELRAWAWVLVATPCHPTS